MLFDTHRRAGRRELLQHVWDDDLQQSLSEELLPHRAAVVIIFLPGGGDQKHAQLRDFVTAALPAAQTIFT